MNTFPDSESTLTEISPEEFQQMFTQLQDDNLDDVDCKQEKEQDENQVNNLSFLL
jgi:hypothetical protein